MRLECYSMFAFGVWSLGGRSSFYYLFMVIVIITYEANATAGRALTFVVRIFVNDTVAIAVWTSFDTITITVWISFHLCVPRSAASPHKQPLAAPGRAPLSGRAKGDAFYAPNM